MTTIDIILLIIGSGAFSSLVTWLTTTSLRNADVKKKEAEAGDLLSRTYALLIKDLNTQLTNLKSINSELELSKDKLIRDIRDLETEVEQLRKQVVKLTNRLKKYEEDGQEV